MIRPPITLATVAALFWLAGWPSCRTADRRQPFPLHVTAKDDRGDPVAGVQASAGARPLGRTGLDGLLHTTVMGADGDRLDIEVSAPLAYRLLSSSRATGVLQIAAPVGHNNAEPQPVRILARLAPRARRYAVLVLTDGRANLPVTVGGAKKAVTDAWGVAQLLHEGPPGGSLCVGIDTTAWPRLRPANPELRFDLSDREDILLLWQDFREPLSWVKAPGRRRRDDSPRRHPPRRF